MTKSALQGEKSPSTEEGRHSQPTRQPGLGEGRKRAPWESWVALITSVQASLLGSSKAGEMCRSGTYIPEGQCQVLADRAGREGQVKATSDVGPPDVSPTAEGTQN